MKITKEKLWTWSRNRTDSHGRGWNIRTPPLSTRSAKSKGICQVLSKLIVVIDQQFTYRYKKKINVSDICILVGDILRDKRP